MAAILDGGFEDPPPVSFRPPERGQSLGNPFSSRQPFQSSNGYSNGHANGYSNGHSNGNGYTNGYEPRTPNMSMPNTGDSVSSSVESRSGQGHAKKRSGGAGVDRYGPLGPLADDDLAWGRPNGNPFTGRKL